MNGAVELQSKLASVLAAHPALLFLWMGIVVLVLISLMGMGMVLRRLRLRGELSFTGVKLLKMPDSDALLLLFILSWLMVIPVGAWFFPAVSIGGVIWLLRRHGIDAREQWGSGRLSWGKLVGLVLWTYLVVMGLLLPVSWVMDQLAARFHWHMAPQIAVELLLESGSPWKVGWLLFLAVILAPVSEEILFRGFLYPLLKSRLPVGVAWVLTAAIFAAIHFHAMTFPQLFVLGLVLAAAYEITGSLALCVGIHMCFNFVSAGVLLVIKYATV
ncbi:MAG: hypothetical protein B9S32_11245 [Verrucomicrobia bacterium Tous-C9LFEB]|nr:MAG: hypothetical protein B9S32_11245 [Verrucomicrobia bacterium Tous-C9LFEB]